MAENSVSRFLSFCVVLLGCSASLFSSSVLNFPRLSNSPGTITGVTFVNPGGVAAPITVTAYGQSGSLIQGAGIHNPAQLTVPAKGQLGLLTSDPLLFGPGLPPDVVGWFQAVSPVDGITGFFLFLDNPGNSTFLDGADLPPLEHKIIFNRIQVGGGSSTELNLFNTGSSSTVLDLLLINGEELLVRTLENDDAVPARGGLRLDVASFFGVSSVADDAYVLVISDTLIGGFELVRTAGRDLLGLNARPAGEVLNSIFFPQLAVLGPWKMEIGVTNYSPEPVGLVITAYEPDGRPYGLADLQTNPVSRNLGAGAGLREDVEEMFGFSGTLPLDGWIEVLATQNAVNGYVNYGVSASGSIAAVAAPARALRQAIFSHIATTQGFFTGVAALNPSAKVASLRIAALTAQNRLLGVFDTVLKPRERISKTLQEMIPEAAGQAGGIIWITSDQPLYLTSLFGTGTGKVLSNIPPQPGPEEYRPDAAVARLDVQPVFSVLRVSGAGVGGDSQQFNASPGPVAWRVENVPGGNSDLGTLNSSGLYLAPAQLPAPSPVSISAVKSASGATPALSAGATVDLLDNIPLAASRDLTQLFFLPRAGRLLGVVHEGGSSIVSELTLNGETLVVEFSDLWTFANEEVTAGAVFPGSSGDEYLLLSVRRPPPAASEQPRLVRLDPRPQGAVSIDIVPSLSSPYRVLAFDSVTRNVLAASDSGGVVEVSGATVEADLVSQAAAGSGIRQLFQTQYVRGMAVDPCTDEILFTRQVPREPANPGSTIDGEMGSYSRLTRQIRTDVSRAVWRPGAVLPLQRRSGTCGTSSHFILVEEGDDQLSLFRPHDSGQMAPQLSDWFPVQSPTAVGFLPFDQSLYSNEAVVVMGETNGGSFLNIIDTLNLYQNETVNPLQVRAVNSESDRADDFFGFEAFQHDILETSARFEGNSLVIEVFFGDTIAACVADSCFDANVNPLRTVTGYVDLDLDLDIASGVLPAVDFNSPYTAGIGVDFSLDFTFPWAGGTVIADRFSDGTSFDVPVQLNGNSLKASIPVSVLGGAKTVYVSAVFGTSDEPTDVSSNLGFFVASPGGSGNSSSEVILERVGVTSSVHMSPVGRSRSSEDEEGRGWVRRTRLPGEVR